MRLIQQIQFPFPLLDGGQYTIIQKEKGGSIKRFLGSLCLSHNLWFLYEDNKSTWPHLVMKMTYDEALWFVLSQRGMKGLKIIKLIGDNIEEV